MNQSGMLNHTPVGSRAVYFLIFFVVVGCYLTSAWFNMGPMSYDEHYQILEFAHHKWVGGTGDELPWEYKGRVRSAIQPTLAYLLTGAMRTINLSEPFHQAFVLRLISAAFCVFCLYRFFLAVKEQVSVPVVVLSLLIFSFLFYRLPYLGVRFSSENWSACFFILGLSVIITSIDGMRLSPPWQKFLVVGVLFGLSFLFRFQSAILFVGLSIWVLVFNRRNLKLWGFAAGGFLGVCVWGVFIDRWFYEEWAFTSWNYFRVNLIEGKAAEFGVEPWWWYLRETLSFGKMLYFEGLILLLTLVFFIKNYRSPITWAIVPFILVHFLIGHKEMRFLSVVAYVMPFMVVSTLGLFEKLLPKRQTVLLYLLMLMIFGANAFLLTAAMFHTNNSSIAIFKYLVHFSGKPVKIYHQSVEFYYTLANGKGQMAPYFYRRGMDYKIRGVERRGNIVGEFMNLTADVDTLQLLILDKPEQQDSVVGKLKVVYDPDYDFIKKLNYRSWMRRNYSSWKLYAKKGDQLAQKFEK
jgi:GPI mannosyltransferase 3